METTTKSFVCSAPGKVILFGEHAVVLGKTAIATALGLRTYAFFEEWNYTSQQSALTLDLPDLGVSKQWTKEQLETLYDHPAIPANLQALETLSFDDCKKAVQTLIGETSSETVNRGLTAFLFLYFSLHKQKRTTTERALRVRVRSKLPVGMGLGSSAAFSVSIVAGLVEVFEIVDSTHTGNSKVQRNFINSWAFQAEKVMHGTPSGIDNSVSTFGGTLTLTKINGVNNIQHLERTPALQFVLTNTKVPRNTLALVKKVGEFHKEKPDEANPILDEIHQISQKCVATFADHENISRAELCQTLGGMMDRNHLLLCKLGVGHASLDTVCRVTASFGLHSKLTGAGGGGCALTLINDGTDSSVVESALKALEKEGYECFSAEVGGSGVLVQNPSEVAIFKELFP